MRPVRNSKDGLEVILGRVAQLETDLKTLRGDGGVGQVYGDLDMNRGRCVNASPSQQQNDYITRGELEEAIGTQLKFKTFNSATATFDLDYQAESATSILVFVNAGKLVKDLSGNNGYSVDLNGGAGGVTRITTNRTMLATDTVLVLYVKKAL